MNIPAMFTTQIGARVATESAAQVSKYAPCISVKGRRKKNKIGDDEEYDEEYETDDDEEDEEEDEVTDPWLSEIAFEVHLPFPTTSFSFVRVTNGDVDDILDTAMMGCTYWCRKAEPVGGRYLGQYANEQISRGGTLRFYPENPGDGGPFEFTLDKFRDGFYKWFKNVRRKDYYLCDDEIENGLDCGKIDAEDADSILQYALFDDIVYS